MTLLVSCSDSTQTDTVKTDNYETPNSVSNESEIFNISGEDISIRTGPGKEFEKLKNKKATEVTGKVEYCTVDYSVKVIISEKKGDWTKIKVVDPDWLSETYIGWIPSKYIITQHEANKDNLSALSSNDYEIIKTRHNSAVQNFHILLKRKKFDKNYLYQFSKEFRKEHCTMNCNVIIYDTKAIMSLIDVYPLDKKSYIKMADHLLSFSTFDAAEVRDWYPYQDFQYRDYGGKNWKKEPIK